MLRSMKQLGKSWEKKIALDAQLWGHSIVKIPEQFVGIYGKNPIQKKTGFDFAISIDQYAAFFDAKEDSTANFNLKKHVIGEKKQHQLKALLECEARGDCAGYLINFTHYKKIGFIAAQKIFDLAYKTGQKSIRPIDCCEIQDDVQAINFRKLLNIPYRYTRG